MKNALILILIILLINIPLAASFTSNDIEWAPAKEGTLYQGDTLINEPYMVKAVQFPSPVQGFKDFSKNIVPETPVNPMVYLEVYKNGAMMKEIVMNTQSGADVDPDYEVNIAVTGILAGNAREWVFEYYKPWATVSLSLRGKPKLEVKVTTDKTTYTSNTDEILTANVEVKNSGDAVARNVDVNLNPGDLMLRGGSNSQFHNNYLELKKGETESFSVILLVPKVSADKSYPLSVDAKGYDVKDLEYTASSSSSITISPKPILPRIFVSKSVKPRIYLKDTMVVRVTVANGGEYDAFDINLTDSNNDNFELKSDSPMQWEIPSLKPGQDWSTTYSIKPLETNLNGFIIPAAKARFTIINQEYNASSDSPSVIVNGPKIILNKTVNKQKVNVSEDITVTVSIKNTGNIATKAQVTDYLPESVSLVSGSTKLDSIFLEVDKPQGFSYIIRPNTEGTIELPAAMAEYMNVEYRGSVRSALSSESPVINVIDPNKIILSNNSNSNPSEGQGNIPVTLPDTTPSSEATPEITPTPVTSFIDPFFTILLLILAAVFRHK
jgi:uncharacterized repeat protein (TIGR01451 family)